MLTSLQGDALSVPISIKLNGEEVTTADIQAVKVTMGGVEKRYPGEITYDSGRFLFPLTQTGEAAGGTVVLQYLPYELVGNYFVEVI